MIELSEEQRQRIQNGIAVRVTENGHDYVLLRPDVYDHLAEGAYDAGPWSGDELDRLREEAVEFLDHYGKEHATEPR